MYAIAHLLGNDFIITTATIGGLFNVIPCPNFTILSLNIVDLMPHVFGGNEGVVRVDGILDLVGVADAGFTPDLR